MENNKINSSGKNANNSASAATLPKQEDELHYAILSGDIDLVKSLLEKPETDVNAFTKNFIDYEEESKVEEGWFYTTYERYFTAEITPLFVAIKKHNLEMVKLLVNHPKIDINLGSTLIYNCNGYKMTPLIFTLAPIISCYKPVEGEDKDSLIKIARVLLNHPSIDVNAHFLNRTTPFQTAIKKDCPEIVELFIDRPEINVNKPIEYLENKTPLEYAIGLFNGFELVNVLLKNKNLDLNTKNADGKSLFDLAFEKIPFDFSDEKKAVKITKLIFARRISDINEKTEDIKEKQKKMLEQKKILKNKRKEIFSEYSKELSTIDELMEEYFPKTKSECNIF